MDDDFFFLKNELIAIAINIIVVAVSSGENMSCIYIYIKAYYLCTSVRVCVFVCVSSFLCVEFCGFGNYIENKN